MPAVLTVFAVAACATPAASRPAGTDPTALVGMWKPAQAGEDAGTMVGLTPTDLTVHRDCGSLFGSWRADTQGLFVADVNGSGGECDPSERVPWLAEAAAFRIDDGTPVLLDRDGRTVARLMPGAEPPRPEAESFEVTEEFRRALAPPAALPAPLTAAGRAQLVGRWEPAGGAPDNPQPAHLRLGADGRWSASDGCNGSAGGWVVGPGGTVLATSGVSTLIGCDNVPVGGWLSSARLAGFDGDVLVLLDAEAGELGRLQRS